jgi:hypothetical protein
MTPLENLLSRLQKVKGKNGSWTACCPSHEDASPSLAVREGEDGRVLIHCFGGCSTADVLGSMGLDMTDLFPPKREWVGETQGSKPMKPAFYASDLLRIISFECLVVSICAYDMSQGKKIAEGDRERLKVAQQRIEEVMRYANI